MNPTSPRLAACFKAQLLDYVDDRDEPFDTQFLVANCNSLVDDAWIRHVLWELEEEGRIVRLNHHYLSARVLMKRWTSRSQSPPPTRNDDQNDVVLPHHLLHEIQDLLVERPELGYLDIGEFIRDALRRRIHQLETKHRNEKS